MLGDALFATMGPPAQQQQQQQRGQAVERLLSVGSRQPGARIPPAEVSAAGLGFHLPCHNGQ